MSAPQPRAMAHTGAGLWTLVRTEFLLNVRGAGWLVMALLLSVVMAASVYLSRQLSPYMVAVAPQMAEQTRGVLETLLLAMTPLVVAGAALREHRFGMDELIQSKPPSSQALVWTKFAGIYLSLLALALVAACAAAATCAAIYWPDVPLAALLRAAARVALPMLFLAALSFALVTATGSALVAGLVVALHLGVGMAASAYLMPAVRYTLTPYHASYALIGLAIVGLVAGTWLRGRDTGVRVPASLVAAAACLIAGLASNAVAAGRWGGYSMEPPTPQVRPAERGKPSPDLLTARWTGMDGRPVSLAGSAGKPLLLVVWSESAADSASVAASVEEGWRAAGPGRVGFATVCLCGDAYRAADLAAAAGLREPVIFCPAGEADNPVGIVAALGMAQAPGAATGVLLDGGSSLVNPMVQVPMHVASSAPHREWAARLRQMTTTAVRQLAERGN